MKKIILTQKNINGNKSDIIINIELFTELINAINNTKNILNLDEVKELLDLYVKLRPINEEIFRESHYGSYASFKGNHYKYLNYDISDSPISNGITI